MFIFPVFKALGWSLACIFGLLLFVVLLPTFVLVFVVSLTSSTIVSVLIRLKYGNKITRAEGTDAMFGKKMTTSLPYINTLCRVHGKPDIEEIRRTFNIDIIEARNTSGDKIYGKFTQLFDKRFGYYIWKESKNFDIKNHIRLVTMQDVIDEINIAPQPPQEESSPTEKKKLIKTNNNEDEFVTFKNGVSLKWEEVVHHFMAKHGTALMKKQLPQWEILIAIEDENNYLCLFRVHHSISDGINLSRFVLEAMFKTSIQVPIKIEKYSSLKNAVAMVLSLTFLPFEIATLIYTKFSKNPLHGPKLSGEKIYLVSRMYSLQFLKNLKSKSGATINNILLSCISHALSSHFERRSADVRQVNVMTPYAMQNMAKPLKLQNEFNLIRFRLPTSLNNKHILTFFNKSKSPTINYLQTPELQRLQLVKDTLDIAKANIGHLSINWIGKKLGYLLPARISEALFNSEGITMFLSNVPGPQVELSYWDGVQKELIFWIPDRDPMGLGLSIMSYNGRLRVTLIVDKALMNGKEEAQQFMDDFDKALSNLEEDVWQLVNSFDDVV